MLYCILLISLLISHIALAKNNPLVNADHYMQHNQLQKAAIEYCSFTKQRSKKKYTPRALLMCGRLLDSMADYLTEKAEKKCYWSKSAPRTPVCMQKEAKKLNALYGKQAFYYDHSITYIPYSGSHYKKLLKKYKRSDYAAEADFYLLLRELIGHPDIVLPKIKSFLKRHSSGKWHTKGLLLWARVNEDVWFVHRKWSWVLFNDKVAPDELIIRAEPYRKEALRTYKKLRKSRSSFEKEIASKEYKRLKASKDDNITYSIVNDSHAGTLHTWGIHTPQFQHKSSHAPETTIFELN